MSACPGSAHTRMHPPTRPCMRDSHHAGAWRAQGAAVAAAPRVQRGPLQRTRRCTGRVPRLVSLSSQGCGP